MKIGDPNNAPVKEIIVSHLPKAGTFFISKFFICLLRFGIQSSTQPTGHTYLQINRFLNQVTVKTKNPIPFNKTSDFSAKTELSIIKGLIQFDKPESFPHPKGNATKIAITRKTDLMVFLLTKINIWSQ